MFVDELVTATGSPSLSDERRSTPWSGEPAFCSARGIWTYGELPGLVAALAARLRAAGVGRGDRVLVALPSGPEFVVGVFATTLAGAVAVPVPLSCGRDRLAYVAEVTRSSVALVVDEVPTPAGVRRLPVWLEALARERAAVARHPESHRDEVAMVLFSSGSTGRPKGVPLTHRQLLAAARHLAETYRFGAGHQELLVAPMCHSDGWQRTAATLYTGGLVAVGDGFTSMQALLDDIQALGATGIFVPPPLVPFLVRARRADVAAALESCRTVEIGSALFAPAVIRGLLDRLPGADLFLHYGLTECSRALVLDVRAHPDKLHTVGRPGRGIEIGIRDDDGRPVPPNTAGQIFLRAPHQCTSYYERPDLDAERFVDGWLATGDFGSLDADGFVTLLGRRDDMVTSGGHHFFPAEVEVELGPVDGVSDYVVAGIADPAGIMGQVVWAFVVPADTASFTSHHFVERARTRLPPHMRPRKVVVVAEIPRTPSGKPDRRKMGAAYSA
jgi:acyl-CoA synthetase (AMP-forming)/AMP-acid ligase II